MLKQALSITLASILCVYATHVIGQEGKPSQVLSAKESDPRALGWMLGAPPAKNKRIMQPQADYFSFPKLRWTVCHIRELMPTKAISRGLEPILRFEQDLDQNIDLIKFVPTGSIKPMTWQESLGANYTDGILVLHKGKIVYQQYDGCLGRLGKHAAMSMTKSVTGLMAEILIAEGKLDENEVVGKLIPELKQSAFGDATVRQVMDMTTSLQYSEDYADPNADIWVYSTAADPLPKPASYQGPVGYYEYLSTVKKQAEHGKVFGYKTINTDVLGWLVARATNAKLTDVISERLWQNIGAEQDAYMTIDAIGTPFAGGGLSAGLIDLAKIGQLMLNKGVLDGKRLFDPQVVDNITKGGDKNAFAHAGYSLMPNGSYRSMWWVFHNKHKAYAARGVHGQTIYIDPTAEMVIVRFASFPQAKNALIDPTSLPAYQALAEYLLSKSE